ncbi:tetratricopeptide repeat protein, partial [bacterium]|nr:tetratricopeptide repeat protein [bacterium]
AEYLEKAVRLVPDNAEIHFNLGIVLIKKGDLKSAIFHLKKALKLDPGNNIASEILNSINRRPS